MRTRPILLVLALTATGLAPLVGHSAGATDVAGIPATNVGVHGPISNHLAGLELVGSTPITKPGRTKPALGNNGGVALIGNCAYVGRWHDYNEGSRKNGVSIIDVANPAAPTYVGEIADTIRSGGVAREIRAIDLPGFQMLTVMVFAQATGDRRNNLIQTYTFPTGDCRAPVLRGTFDMVAFRGHEFFQWIDPNPAHNVEGHPRVLVFITAPVTAPNLLVVDISRATLPVPVGFYDAGQPIVSPNEQAGTYLGTYAHSVSLSDDGKEALVSYWDGGLFAVDSSTFALGAGGTFLPKGARSIPLRYPITDLGNTHSAVRVPGTNTAVVGDEIYLVTDGCPFGWMRTVDLGNETTPPSQVGEYKLAENINCNTTTRTVTSRNSLGLELDGTFSMHNQTVVGRYALASWYGGGLRVVDVGNPAAPVEVGSFVPTPVDAIDSNPTTPAPTYGTVGSSDNDWWVAMWSYPVVRNGLIYVVDVRNGLYILRAVSGTPLAATLSSARFAEGNSNLGALLPAAP